MKNRPLQICNATIQPGERVSLALPTPELYTCAPLYIPIHVIHGKKEGPVLLITAAMHGDEVNGTAIIQRLLNLSLMRKLSGTLILIPVINVFGLINRSSHLADRGDLSVSFPGSETGSLTSRIAHLLTTQIISHATHCVDLRTGPYNSMRLPQIYANLKDDETVRLARAFHAPVIIHTESKEGLLWQTHEEGGKPTFVFEAGESFRINEFAVKAGANGVIRLMRELGMLKFPAKGKAKEPPSLMIRKTHNIRSPGSGIVQILKPLGAHIQEGDILGAITDPFGTQQEYKVQSPTTGILIGVNHSPLVNEGENIFSVATSKDSSIAGEQVSLWRDQDETISMDT